MITIQLLFKTSVFCGLFNYFIAFLNIISTFDCFPTTNLKRPRLALESARSASAAKDTIQLISHLNNKERTRFVYESLSNNKTQSYPIFARKLQRPQSGNLDVNLNHKI